MEQKSEKIYGAIADVITKMGAIAKTKKTEGGKFAYTFRGVDDVMNALHGLFAEYRIFVSPEVLEQTREERTSKSGGNQLFSILKIRFTFYAEDGSYVQAVTVGEGMDSGDKASNKAMSVAFKYACFQVFCIPTEEIPDPDAQIPPPTVRKSAQGAENAPKLVTDVRIGNLESGTHTKVSLMDMAKPVYLRGVHNDLKKGVRLKNLQFSERPGQNGTVYQMLESYEIAA